MNQSDVSRGYINPIMEAPELAEFRAEVGAQKAEKAISELKRRGRWCRQFEHQNLLRVMFAELAPPHVEMLVDCVTRIVENEPTNALLSNCAQFRSREKGISFGEALNEVAVGVPGFTARLALPDGDSQGGAWGAGVSPAQRQAERSMADRAVEGRIMPSEIVELAWKLANEKGWPLKQAIAQVSGEHPEILKNFAAENLHRAFIAGQSSGV